MKNDNLIHGFTLEREEEVKDIKSTAKLFTHKKTGAKLLYLKNDDDNKVFSIGFRTPPDNSTGIPHILEHSVLCGSKNYPVKEPFVELIKGSLNTFLNAMTFSDKTIYPLASTNNKDFMNLMGVYLDAVFYPAIYNKPEIMMQEGWHYELNNAEDELTIKGVVYNEMKGAFSSVDDLLQRKIQESLLKGTIYGNESGGDPDYIPDLTQEEFIQFHSKYYHPSNSYIYVYGNCNIDEVLQLIGEKYLDNFEEKQVESSIKDAKRFNEIKEFNEYYSVAEGENLRDKTYLTLNFITGTATDPEVHLAMDVLEFLLLETQGAPLKKAIIDNNIGTDVYGSLDASIKEPLFSIIVKGSDASKKEQFKKVVYDTLKDLVQNGIDKKLIEACINITEFKLREADFGSIPKGLFYYLEVMDSWLYDGDPLTHLKYENSLNIIKRGLNNRYFEKLIEKYLLDNNFGSLLVLQPQPGLSEKKEKALKDKLKLYKDSLSKEQVEDIINKTKKLLQIQTTPDTKENLEKIPLLELSDIGKEVEDLAVNREVYKGITILHHNTFTSKIAYINFMFDATVISREDVPYLSILAKLLGKINTKNYKYEDLSNEILINTGGITFNTEAYGDDKENLKYYPFMEVHCKAMGEKIPQAFNILNEILTNTLFDDKKRFKEIIQMIKSRIEMSLIDRGHQVVAMRLCSYFNPASLYFEDTIGYNFYHVISEVNKNLSDDNYCNELFNKLRDLMTRIFNRNNVIVAVTGEEDQYNIVKSNLSSIMDNLPCTSEEKHEYKFTEERMNEGLMTPSDVQFVGKGYNYKKLGFDYTGKLLVLKTILGLDYLWNKVRVQGGAYGGFANIVRSGNLVYVSYRDPNIKETLDAYDNSVDYLKNFNADNREMTKYIIGTISDLDSPLTPLMKGDRAVSYYLRHISKEDRQRERQEVLSTTMKDIRNFEKLISAVLDENYLIVLGNKNKIESNKELFNNLVNVFK